MRLRALLLIGLFLLPITTLHAQALPISAKEVAIYGWKNGEPIPIYVKNENRLYPIASLTKLITAKAVLDLYPEDKTFTISKKAAATEGTVAGIAPGATFTRNDLLTALLVRSSNDAATAFMEPVGASNFLKKMNDILHKNNYTHTSFNNPSGLDPARKLHILPNRMTAFNMSRLISDIYVREPLLAKIMSQPETEVINQKTDSPVMIRNTNRLFRIDDYKDKILMSKTGLTNMAGQNVAFVTSGGEGYDYVTVVMFGCKSRTTDGQIVLNWLDTQLQSSTSLAESGTPSRNIP